ncbi:iron-sulfur cluster assembly accessory protein [Spongiibacter nanhainus]|uniref:Iron-sulfur cluster assembly accessory protein n=1 Tax=Spongiibacter nanhainus TaxID=2794344 RepID=A0A7T4QYN7_9GAMM|nr:iron-sulfur cluster assembly accessory protein [Spongiibacter nanhainus]QQD17127.1 iron-sulfur cluster assembly accessory protein [Spongiibacter nanhainus]
MSVETFAPEQAVTVTDAAQAHFQKQLAEKPSGAVRLSVKSSGCTGYKYVIDIVEQGQEGDVALKLDNGLTLLVASDAMGMVRGTEIDYTREGLNQMLKFNNPNVSDECGCGESFNVG